MRHCNVNEVLFLTDLARFIGFIFGGVFDRLVVSVDEVLLRARFEGGENDVSTVVDIIALLWHVDFLDLSLVSLFVAARVRLATGLSFIGENRGKRMKNCLSRGIKKTTKV